MVDFKTINPKSKFIENEFILTKHHSDLFKYSMQGLVLTNFGRRCHHEVGHLFSISEAFTEHLLCGSTALSSRDPAMRDALSIPALVCHTSNTGHQVTRDFTSLQPLTLTF